jgi:hypothetical protein
MSDGVILAQALRDTIPPLYIRAFGGAESHQYAKDFIQAFLGCGLIAIDPVPSGVPGSHPGASVNPSGLGFMLSWEGHWATGVNVYIPPEEVEATNPVNDRLVVALKKVGVEVEKVWRNKWPGEPIAAAHWTAGRRILIIGEKPPLRL